MCTAAARSTELSAHLMLSSRCPSYQQPLRCSCIRLLQTLMEQLNRRFMRPAIAGGGACIPSDNMRGAIRGYGFLGQPSQRMLNRRPGSPRTDQPNRFSQSQPDNL